MSNIINFASTQTPRVELLQLIKDAVPMCADAAAQDVGPAGVQQFFDGYKDCIELLRKAA